MQCLHIFMALKSMDTHIAPLLSARRGHRHNAVLTHKLYAFLTPSQKQLTAAISQSLDLCCIGLYELASMSRTDLFIFSVLHLCIRLYNRPGGFINPTQYARHTVKVLTRTPWYQPWLSCAVPCPGKLVLDALVLHRSRPQSKLTWK